LAPERPVFPPEQVAAVAPAEAVPAMSSAPPAPSTPPGVEAPSLVEIPPQPAQPVPATADWQTAADEGWQAASALAEEHEFTTTATGLPKRVPMSQLVPGGIEKGTVSAQKRTPEAVRGLLSAYHRGVQRGRTTRAGESKTPEHTTAGPQSSQGGKEQEA
jgi:hypothetical protein